MTRDDIIRMSQAADAHADSQFPLGEYHPAWVLVRDERFAELVAEAERKHLLATDIHSCHANCRRFACVQARAAVAAEREACADVCDGHYDTKQAARSIRARGEKE
jgi:hypothetical protein